MQRTILLFILLLAASAGAATWHVVLDGSGDFTRIQPAIEAAADGDTLLLGPGRFDDEVDTDIPGYSGYLSQANLSGKSLTLIGSGRESTIIGPVVHEGTGDWDPRGLVSWPTNSGHTVLEDLQIQNVRDGVNLHGGSFHMERCKVTGTEYGLFLETDQGSFIAESEFYDMHTAWFVYNGSENTRFEDCTIDECTTGLSTNASGTVDVTRCSVRATSGLVYLATIGTVRDCEIIMRRDNAGHGLMSTDGSQVICEDTVIRGGGEICLHVVFGGQLTGSGNVFTAGAGFTCIYMGTGHLSLSESHILGGGDRFRSKYCTYDVQHVDLRNNYWGFETAEEIEASIIDWYDDPDRCRIVDYEPFYPRPVENEERSWGSVKSLFK